jgi:hypothetical protein
MLGDLEWDVFRKFDVVNVGRDALACLVRFCLAPFSSIETLHIRISSKKQVQRHAT